MFVEGGRCLRAQGPWARYGAGDRSSALFPLSPKSEIDGRGMKATPLESTKSTNSD